MLTVDLLSMSLTGVVMALAVVVARALLLKRLPKTTFVALWTLVALRLLVPVAMPMPVNAYSLLEKPAQAVTEIPVVRQLRNQQATQTHSPRHQVVRHLRPRRQWAAMRQCKVVRQLPQSPRPAQPHGIARQQQTSRQTRQSNRNRRNCPPSLGTSFGRQAPSSAQADLSSPTCAAKTALRPRSP